MTVSTQAPANRPAEGAAARPWAIKQLPPFPAVALQLMSLLDDAEAPMRKIVDLLRVDPALSAEVLRVSNSALYGLSRRVDNVSHAVVVMGTEAVKRLALTVALGRFSERFMHNESLRICWDHSVAAGLCGERLAEVLHQPRDRCYTAGLLHDVGRLALLACHPNEYGNLIEVARDNDFDELECERGMFDIDHCAAGEWLGRHWNLPDDIVACIADHHSRVPDDESLSSIVAAANLLADALGYNVLRMPPSKSVEEVLAMLPCADPQNALERFENFDQAIGDQIAAVSPRR